MEKAKLSRAAKKLTSSAIQELSHLAQRCNAINLAEGFPDFPAPPHLKNAAVSAIHSDFNQYRSQAPRILKGRGIKSWGQAVYSSILGWHVQGICDHLAKMVKEMHGLNINPLTDIAICCGQTEAFAAAIFATIDPGDEVIIFDPSYETYEGCVTMAGGVPIYVALDPPQWTLDPSKLLRSFTERTKAIVLNSPHNPTGKVFSEDELEIIAGACRSRDCLAITDEEYASATDIKYMRGKLLLEPITRGSLVYEHITYENEKHISLATFPGMQERTIITSSLSKTFSVTGWRVGWAIAPSFLASAIRNIHIRVTDSAPAPFQEAALTALRSPPEYFESLKRDYQSKRDYIVTQLAGVGFKLHFIPQGSIFLFAELPDNSPLSDVEFVKKLITEAGVVAVPGQGFFHQNLCSNEASNETYSYYKRYIRFAFCKSNQTLAAVSERLGKLLDPAGHLVLG